MCVSITMTPARRPHTTVTDRNHQDLDASREAGVHTL